MEKTILLATSLTAAILITGCAPANVAVALRESSSDTPSMQTRCIDFKTGNDSQVNGQLKQYDGWKVAYASEYTTGNKATTSMVMCFERPFEE